MAVVAAVQAPLAVAIAVEDREWEVQVETRLVATAELEPEKAPAAVSDHRADDQAQMMNET